MLGASFLPARFRHDHTNSAPANPGFFSRRITPILQRVAGKAFTHPIHTIVFVMLLASTSYVGFLEGGLSDHASLTGDALGATDLASLIKGSRLLSLGEQTAWKWQTDSGLEGQPYIVSQLFTSVQIKQLMRF